LDPGSTDQWAPGECENEKNNERARKALSTASYASRSLKQRKLGQARRMCKTDRLYDIIGRYATSKKMLSSDCQPLAVTGLHGWPFVLTGYEPHFSVALGECRHWLNDQHMLLLLVCGTVLLDSP